MLRTGLRAVHDRMASVDRERILQVVQSLLGGLVTRVDHPSVGLHQSGRTQVLVAVPPVGRARGRAAGAEDALVEAVQLGTIIDALQVLLSRFVRFNFVVTLQPWLDGSVLLIEVGHVLERKEGRISNSDIHRKMSVKGA